MGTSKGKGKARSKKLAVKKQPIKDLEARKGKGSKGGGTTSTESFSRSTSTNPALNFTSTFQKV